MSAAYGKHFIIPDEMRFSFLRWFRRKWLTLHSRAATQDQFGASSSPHIHDVVDIDDNDDPDFFTEPVRLEITDVFDLHTIAPRDVERVVEEYLLEARRAKFRSVRIIHGKGRGVQRRMVQAILARTPFIRDWTDAPPQSGGWGATVAHLRRDEDDQD